MYLDWARAIEEYQLLVTEEHQKRVCSYPVGDKSTALDLFENDVTGCLDTVFAFLVEVWNRIDSSVLEHLGRHSSKMLQSSSSSQNPRSATQT